MSDRRTSAPPWRPRTLAWVLACALLGCGPEPAPRSHRPNVILVVVDTLRADRLGWYGGGIGLLPFVDGLADSGTVFWNAYAPSSWTCPVVASLFTSRVPSQHRVETFSSILDAGEETLAEQLRAAGYGTASLTANLLINPTAGYDQGFDHFRVYFTGAIKERADVLTRDALAWIAESQRTRPESPFFLYLHLMEPHEPLQPPREALAAIAARRPDDPGHLERLASLAHSAPPLEKMSPQQVELARELYDAEVASLDAPLQRFFATLSEKGILADSLVVVTADHGEEFLEHGGVGHGHTLYNEIVHVPLLVSLPGQSRRMDVYEAVSLLDLAPTILEAAGMEAPASFEGRSRVEQLRRSPWVSRLLAWLGGGRGGSAYSEMGAFGATKERPKLHVRALVVGGDKLIERHDGEREAYDLDADPGETQPKPAIAQVELQAELDRRREALVGVRSPLRTRGLDDETRERMRALGYDDTAH